MKNLTLVVAVTTLGCLFPASQPALAQNTAFTYQGRLNGSGGPANGLYDFNFTLYATSNSVPIAAVPVTNLSVGVSNGLFSASVDFGPGVFAGNSNWLAIAVRTNGPGVFSTLAPRQPVTPVPYAVYAAGAATAVTAETATTATTAISVPAANVTGALADARLSTNVALRLGGNTFAGNQTVTNGSVGVGTTTPNYRLSLGGDYLNTKLAIWDGATSAMGFGAATGQFRINLSDPTNRFSFLNGPAGAEIMTLLGNGRLGVGATNPAANLHVLGATAYNTAMIESTDAGGSWLRLQSDTIGGKDWALVSTGPGVLEGAGHLLFYDIAADNVRLDLAPNGGVGIGTTLPAAALHVVGDIIATGNVRLNSNTYAVAGVESNLRVIRGFVNYDGSPGNGSGFTVSHQATGVYKVTFQQPYTQYPIVTLGVLYGNVGAASVQLTQISSLNFTVETFLNQFATDLPFNFIAISP